MTLLLASALDVTVVLALALAAAAVLRRQSASLRHAVLAAAVLVAAAAPAMETLLPQWEVPVTWTTVAETSSTARLTSSALEPVVETASTVAPEPRLSWRAAVALVWLGGTLVVLAGLLTGIARLALVTRRCRRLESGPWVDLVRAMSQGRGLRRQVTVLQSRHPAVLLTWGLVRPRILVPDGSDAWSAERREIVLAHEFAHIERHDWALQLAAELLRALYWFNPLAWTVSRRLRHESECACDDAVLDGGVDAAEYATHLLQVARLAVGHTGAWASAPAVAHPSTLERRISAMLNHQRHRMPLTRRTSALAAIGALIVGVPVSAIAVTERVPQPLRVAGAASDVALIAPDEPEPQAPVTPPAPAPVREVAPSLDRPSVQWRFRPAPARVREAAPAAQQTPARLAGVLVDQTGAVLPGVNIALTDVQFGTRFTAVTDALGLFAFQDLQPARYELVLRLPGFSIVTNVMPLSAGANVQRTIMMPVGTLEETITVGCAASPVALGTASAGVALMELRRSSERLFESGRRLRDHWVRDAPAVAPPYQDAGATTPVRVGGQIRAPRQLHKVNPICPNAFVPAGNTDVNLVGRIGVDGYMNEVRHAPADAVNVPPAEFVDAALDAVRQWQYSPTLLNGQPVEVNIRMLVRYTRMGGDRR